MVRDIMSKNVLTLQPQDTVSSFISLMENHHIHEAPVVSGKNLVGLVHYKNIVERGITDPTITKIEKIMTNPPLLMQEDSVDRAAEIIFSSGYHAVPVVENNILVGIISVFDIVSILAKSKEFRQTGAEAIMSVAEIIGEKEDIGKARVLMRERNISRLPVVDDYDRLVGVATIFDLLKALKPRERMGWYSMAAEKLTTMGIPISTVMNRNPLTIGRGASLSEVVELLKKYRTLGAIVTEENAPLGIVTMRDILEFYLAGKQKKGTYAQITGVKDEDEFVLATVDRMMRDSVQKISSVYKVHFLFMHVKKYKKAGSKKIKYSVRCRLMTDAGIFISRSFAWDLRDAAGEALDSLERIVMNKKERVRDGIKKRFRKLKQVLNR